MDCHIVNRNLTWTENSIQPLCALKVKLYTVVDMFEPVTENRGVNNKQQQDSRVLCVCVLFR